MSTIIYAGRYDPVGKLIVDYPQGNSYSTNIGVILKSAMVNTFGKTQLMYQGQNYYFLVANRSYYVCVAQNSSVRIGFVFLTELQQSNPNSASEFRDFTINWRDSGKIAEVQLKLNEVKYVLGEVVDKVLQRGEKIELLVEKTDSLNQSAFKFQRASGALRRKMCWKNARMTLLAVFIMICVIAIIAAIVCAHGGC